MYGCYWKGLLLFENNCKTVEINICTPSIKPECKLSRHSEGKQKARWRLFIHTRFSIIGQQYQNVLANKRARFTMCRVPALYFKFYWELKV